MLVLVAVLLSLSIAGFGLIQGRRFFGNLAITGSELRDLAFRLETCDEGLTVLEGLGDRLDAPDTLIRRTARSLSRHFDKEPLVLKGRAGWVMDLDHLLDPGRLYKNHPASGSIEAMPGILMGAGILFTFLGLTIGVFDLDPTDANQLTQGVKTLLGGMSLAFLTSIAGIGAGLWWAWRQKMVVADFKQAVHQLADVLADKPFVLSTEDLNDQLLQFQAVQTRASENLDSTLFKAASRALESSGIKALLEQSLKQNTDKRLGEALVSFKDGLTRISRAFDESNQLNRKLGERLEDATLGHTEPDVRAAAGEKRVSHGVGGRTSRTHGLEEKSLKALQEACDSLDKLIKGAHLANSDIIKNHRTLLTHVKRLDEHWESYRAHLQTMQDLLEKTLTSFKGDMTSALDGVHGQFDQLLAKSLDHFAGALKDFQTTVDDMSALMKDQQGNHKKLSWLGKRQ